MPELFTYVLPHSTDVAVEWALLLLHPDDHELVSAVPLDDSPLIGTPDVDLSRFAGRPLVARCNHGTWLPTALFTPRERCASRLPGEAFAEIRGMMADMARGRPLFSRESVDLDPNYEDNMLQVGTAAHEAEQLEAGPLLYFEDYNCPGMVYLGTKAHLQGLNREGGFAQIVNPRRISPDGEIDCRPEGTVTAKPAPDHWAA
jgi:hypothetical protein